MRESPVFGDDTLSRTSRSLSIFVYNYAFPEFLLARMGCVIRSAC